jgi:cyclopropane fatty-acyl-phospholipid synthase-like methyltransferase
VIGEYYKTSESVAEYIKLAEGISGASLIKKIRKYLPDNSSILEIGSGPGTDWEILSKNYRVTGSDFSLDFLKHLTSTYPDGDFLELDAVSLDTDLKFAGIYSNKVLHHLTDEALEASIQRQHGLLLPDGIICHSFWKGSGSETFKGMFVNYHNKHDLTRIFSAQYRILLNEEYKEFEENDSIFLIAEKR